MRPSPAHLLLAATAWFGVLLQLVVSLGGAASGAYSVGHALIVYFGYFTILTNLLCALALTLPWAAPMTTLGRLLARPGAQTAVAAAIMMVGLVYHAVLRNLWKPEGWQLVADITLHYAVPIGFLLHWGARVRGADLRLARIPVWCTYPLSYAAYALVRGELTGLWPYPFFDASQLGYAAVGRNVIALLLGYVLLCTVLVLLGRRLPAPAHPID